MLDQPFIPELADPVLEDIEEATSRISPNTADALRNANLFLTGGTGFLGSWLVDLLLALNRRFTLGIRITLLTRNKPALATRRPDWITAQEISIIEGDVRSFEYPQTHFTHLVHAATDVGTPNESQYRLADEIVSGSRHVLDMAGRCDVRRYLYLGSGAAVGVISGNLPLTEDAPGSLRPDEHTYAHSKRYAEHLHYLAAREKGFDLVIARGFAFVGPRMPVQKFAMGNFIRDAVAGKSPKLTSSGSSVRSYLYASDAARWLVELLVNGRSGEIYNVGSDTAISLLDLAHRVAKLIGSPVPLAGADSDHSYYVPATERARRELGLRGDVSLDDAIIRTAAWVRNCNRPQSP